jgi:antitoxin YefM
MIHVTYSELRANLAKWMDRANDDRAPILVTRQGAEPIVIMAAADYAAWNETAYLMSTPANREALLGAIAEADAGILEEHDLIR